MFINMKIIFYIWINGFTEAISCLPYALAYSMMPFTPRSTHFLVWDHSPRYEEPLKGIKLGSNFIGNSMGNGAEGSKAQERATASLGDYANSIGRRQYKRKQTIFRAFQLGVILENKNQRETFSLRLEEMSRI